MGPLGKRGDTIVEVLIALAVLGLVLAGAYVSSNRSLGDSRDAQERGEALKIIESQAEQIKTMAKSNPNSLFSAATSSNIFCIDASGNIQNSKSPSQAPPMSSLSSDNFSYTASCTVSTGVSYFLSIERTGNSFAVR